MTKEEKAQEMEMIKDQWYRFHWTWSKGYDIICKFKEKTSSTNVVSYGYTSITVSKYYNLTNSGGPYSEAGFEPQKMENIQLANLEEVYKYFPEERPKEEKITKLEFDKYYYIRWSYDKGSE